MTRRLLLQYLMSQPSVSSLLRWGASGQWGHGPCQMRKRAVQAYKGKGQEYRLFWPSRPEFVRMAARYGATIVPFAGVGAEEGFNMLLDSQEIRNLPVVGSMIEERSRRDVPRARR